jgi:hypothetical protein
MVRRVDGKRWLVRALLVGLASAGVGSGCSTARNGAGMTAPRPIFNGDPSGGLLQRLRGGPLGPKADMTPTSQNP